MEWIYVVIAGLLEVLSINYMNKLVAKANTIFIIKIPDFFNPKCLTNCHLFI